MSEKRRKGNGCRNVAVPVETYEMLANMKAKSGQTIKHLLNQAIRKAYFLRRSRRFQVALNDDKPKEIAMKDRENLTKTK